MMQVSSCSSYCIIPYYSGLDSPQLFSLSLQQTQEKAFIAQAVSKISVYEAVYYDDTGER